jgi:tRNA threonylcarbamoyladenosine biosynthesis protein TsaB
MKLLAIDTSTERASIALSTDDGIYSDHQHGLRQHAQCLLPMIQDLLAQTSMHLNQLDGIVFGRGPGSFTGLRVACSVAKALAFAHDLPVFPVSSLAAIADEVYCTEPDITSETRVLAMLDARMQQIYWACFARDNFSPLEQVTAARDVSVAATHLIVAGVGLETYAPQFSSALQKQIIQQRVVYPEATAMTRLVKQGHAQAVSAADALPVYVRELHF